MLWCQCRVPSSSGGPEAHTHSLTHSLRASQCADCQTGSVEAVSLHQYLKSGTGSPCQFGDLFKFQQCPSSKRCPYSVEQELKIQSADNTAWHLHILFPLSSSRSLSLSPSLTLSPSLPLSVSLHSTPFLCDVLTLVPQ